MKLFLMSDIFLRRITSGLSSDLKPKRQPQKIYFFFEKTEIMSTDRSEFFFLQKSVFNFAGY